MLSYIPKQIFDRDDILDIYTCSAFETKSALPKLSEMMLEEHKRVSRLSLDSFKEPFDSFTIANISELRAKFAMRFTMYKIEKCQGLITAEDEEICIDELKDAVKVILKSLSTKQKFPAYINISNLTVRY